MYHRNHEKPVLKTVKKTDMDYEKDSIVTESGYKKYSSEITDGR